MAVSLVALAPLLTIVIQSSVPAAPGRSAPGDRTPEATFDSIAWASSADRPVTGSKRSSSSTSVDRTDLPGWNITFQTPAGWASGQDIGRVSVLASNNQAGAIFLAPGLYSSFDEMAVDLGLFFQSMGLVAYPMEAPAETRIGGLRAMTSLYASVDGFGRPVHVRIVAMLTPHETGFVVSGMTTPPQMPDLRETVDAIAASVRATPPSVNAELVAALRGRWVFYDSGGTSGSRITGSTSNSLDESVSFDGQGSFVRVSSSSVRVTGSMNGGMEGADSSSSDRGTYTVIGTTLVTTGQSGRTAFDLQYLGDRLVAGGRTYLRAN